ncbi:uncharacterized protein si:ch211-197h24.6 isoform X2 [Scyliorhinus canicula]|uniref:uncharacterized protein si:ch211-197h24.6 isoform X2 n=1 Tax=Scyliorhinus canicula TaxID=7830 RepID=UPI0018F7CB6C|nr:uncharacterized protein si:ch211-197h24.6 isoform X2 [Scyliorhinus canicula]
MSETDEVVQVIQDGNDTAKSDADQTPIIDYGKEIAKQNSNNAAKSETGQIQIHTIDDIHDEAANEVGQADEQTTTGEQEGFPCDVSQDDEQTTSGEQEGFQCDVSQDDEQTTSGEQEGFQCDVVQDDDQTISGEQEESASEVGQVDNQPTNAGHNDALSEVTSVENMPISDEQEAAQDELGQNQTGKDEKVQVMSATSQVNPRTIGGRAVAAKTAVGNVKLKLTGGRASKLTGKTGALTGKRLQTCIGKQKKLASKISRKMVKASSDLLQAKSAPGQTITKGVLAKLKSQAECVGEEKVNVVAADEVQPELTGENEPMSVDNDANDAQETENEMAGVLDEVQADTDLIWPPESAESPASGERPESDGSLAGKEGKSVTMFWCDICKVVCTSALNLQMHFLGFKHKKIEAALKSNVHTEDERTKDEFLDSTETTMVEDHLSKMKLNKAVLGLDYVVEYRNDQKTNPQFVCRLCFWKSELTWFLPHLLGAKHMANYLKKQHPYILKYEGEKLKPSEWKEFVFRKALEIEKTDGRGKVKVVLEKNDTEMNEKTAVKRVAEQSAAEPECKVQKSETAPSTDIEPVTVAAEPECEVEKSEAAPSTNIEPVTAAAEPECEVEKSEAAPSTNIKPVTADEKSNPKEQSQPSTAQVTKKNDKWTGMYLYPDGLPIGIPIKPQPRPLLARQEVTASQEAAATIDDLFSPIGSKLLEDYITQLDFEETIVGLDFLVQYHYVGKTEPLYYCELCVCELPLQCVLSHIFGIKHKMRYIKKRHPELLSLSAGKYKTVVKKKAAEIEKTDGRGRVRVIRDYYGPALYQRVSAAKIASENGDQLQDMECSSYDQDQSTHTETSPPVETRTKKYSVRSQISCLKPASRTSSSRSGSRSEYKSSRRDYSTSKRDQYRKRESSKDTKRSGEDWRDEWERSIKRSKSIKQDKREKERVRERSTRSDRDKDRRKSRSDSKDDYKKRDKPRSSKDDHHKGSNTSVRTSAKPDPAKREAIIKKEIIKYLTSFKVINDTDAGYVKEVMYELSNRLLQFGQKALKITGSAEKLIQETKSCIPADNPRRELHMATNLGSYPGNTGRNKSMQQPVEYPSSSIGSSISNLTSRPVIRNTGVTMSSIHSNLLTPSLLNSIRGMDEGTITSTLSRLAANNPAFEGIRISTLVTVLREAGVLSKKTD